MLELLIHPPMQDASLDKEMHLARKAELVQ